MKNLYQSIAAIFLIAVMFGGADVSRVAAVPDSDLSFNLASASVNVNSDFTLDVMLDPGANLVNGVELYFTYDQTLLRLDNITLSASFPILLTGADISDVNGTGSIAGASNFGTTVSGSPVVAATLSFHSLGTAAADSTVEITGASLITADNELGSVLVNRSGAAVTILERTYSNADFANLAADWLQAGSTATDVNADNIVNARDLGIMMSNWE